MCCTSSLRVELCALSSLRSTSSDETPIQLQIGTLNETHHKQNQKHDWSWQKETLSSIYLAILGVDIVSLKINFSNGIVGFMKKKVWFLSLVHFFAAGRGFKAEYSDCCTLKWFTSILKGQPPSVECGSWFWVVRLEKKKIKKGEETWN